MSTTQEEKKSLTFTIVGGGIAGLATAIALRAPNHTVTVLEQSSLNREIGATISLQPNASKIVEQQWGMAEALKNMGAMRDEAFQMFSIDGKLQRRIPLVSKTEYGADRQMYHRMDLHDTLKHFATRPDGYGNPAEIKVSSCVTACDPDAGTVTLKDGSIVQSDVIIAADGIKSALRKYVLGEEVEAQPTGLSAYRLVASTSDLAKDEEFKKVIDPRESSTAMVMAHDRRVIMGPARAGTIYSVVALVPDKRSNVDDGNSWTSKGDLQTLLEEYKDFPEWVKAPFRLCKEEIGLWQLRDTDPLSTWHRGRVILIGDAAHAMLPTQGQGASQAIEDAEAVGAYFADADGQLPLKDIQERLKAIFDARYERATTIQQYSRDAARPATEKGETLIKMNPAEFMDYNCLYNGAKDWVNRRKAAQELPSTNTLNSGLAALKVS